MTADELKCLQLNNQHITSPADIRTVARDLLGAQAQFPGNALHTLRIRCDAFDEEEARRVLVKDWTIRGTMHVFDPDDLPLFLYEGRGHSPRPRDTMEADECVTAERKRYFANVIVESVRAGKGGREALKEACFAAGMTEREAESVFDPWGGLIRALCENRMLCHYVQERKAYRLCPPFEPMGKAEAKRELARRYFAHYGPATVHDAAYFFNCTQAQVKKQLAGLPVESVECGGRAYFYIGGGPPADAAGIPDCVFLAGFDQLLLGYQKAESLYLPPEHLRGIFNRTGIVMPAVLLHGRVVGKWKREKNKLLVTPFERLSQRKRKTVERAAKRLWSDDIRVIFCEE